MNKQQFEGCIIGGAIGDAWGSSWESGIQHQADTFIMGGIPEPVEEIWRLTDDTQLTLATCEVLFKNNRFDPEELAATFLAYHKQKRLTGLGASTLKALADLQAGVHWNLSGRMGEYAAGNGAAMRIAPLAFLETCSREDVYNACRITHRNDEAYVGALAVFLSIRAIIENRWTGDNNLIEILIPELPDTNVRDRLITLSPYAKNIEVAAELGTNGYVVNSVPFAIFAASCAPNMGIRKMFQQIIQAGGDTDTNASIAGQIAGSFLGIKHIPHDLIQKLKALATYSWIQKVLESNQFP